MLDKPIAKSVAEKGDEVLRLLADGQKIVTLAGQAGSGKTTLIKHIMSQLTGRVVVVSFTGKAVQMLTNKGIENAATIHSTIYHPVEAKPEQIESLKEQIEEAETEGNNARAARCRDKLDELQKPGFVLNEDSILKECSLCIIDEVSMVNEELGKHIIGFGCPVLAVGDGFQLPPVEGEPYFDLDNADVVLGRSHRQKKDSGILDLADDLRAQREPDGDYGSDVSIRVRRKMSGQDKFKWTRWADQILCWTNDTRRTLNRVLKQHHGFKDSRYPQGRGEKLICMRNHKGIVNGQEIQLVDIEDVGDPYSFKAEVRVCPADDGKWVSLGRMNIYKGHFDITAEKVKQTKAKRRLQNDFSSIGSLLQVDWGWCITVHKSQGSQWDKVLVIDQHDDLRSSAHGRTGDAKFARREAFRWYYTAVTRASKELRVIET